MRADSSIIYIMRGYRFSWGKKARFGARTLGPRIGDAGSSVLYVLCLLAATIVVFLQLGQYFDIEHRTLVSSRASNGKQLIAKNVVDAATSYQAIRNSIVRATQNPTDPTSFGVMQCLNPNAPGSGCFQMGAHSFAYDYNGNSGMSGLTGWTAYPLRLYSGNSATPVAGPGPLGAPWAKPVVYDLYGNICPGSVASASCPIEAYASFRANCPSSSPCPVSSSVSLVYTIRQAVPTRTTTLAQVDGYGDTLDTSTILPSPAPSPTPAPTPPPAPPGPPSPPGPPGPPQLPPPPPPPPPLPPQSTSCTAGQAPGGHQGCSVFSF